MTPEAALVADTWRRTGDAVRALDDVGWAAPTRAALWDRRALLLHVLLDAQRALVALHTPAAGPADVDAVSYWRPFRPDHGDGGAAHGRFVARAAAAHEGVAGLLAQWDDTWPAAGRALQDAEPAALVGTQGHVLTVSDLTSTLLVEATVHLLDLDLPDAVPSTGALAHTRALLEGLLGEALPRGWSGLEAVLRGTGREPWPDDPRLPVLG